MLLKTTGIAGTLESSDIMVTVQATEKDGIVVELTSSVKRQFGRQIVEVIEKTAKELGVENALIKAVDKGALEYVIIARTKAAIYRAAESKNFEF